MTGMLRFVGWLVVLAGLWWGSQLAVDVDRNWHGTLSGEGDAPCRLAGTCTPEQLEQMVHDNHRLQLVAGAVIVLGVLLTVAGTRRRPRPPRPVPSRAVLVAWSVLATVLVVVGGLVMAVESLDYGRVLFLAPALWLLGTYLVLSFVISRWATPVRARVAVLAGMSAAWALCLALGFTLFRRADGATFVAAAITYVVVVGACVYGATVWAADAGPWRRRGSIGA